MVHPEEPVEPPPPPIDIPPGPCDDCAGEGQTTNPETIGSGHEPNSQTIANTAEDRKDINGANSNRVNEFYLVTVRPTGPNIFGHSAIAYRDPDTGRLVYYDVQGNDGPAGVVNRYSPEEFRERYGDRNPSFTQVTIPNGDATVEFLERNYQQYEEEGYGYRAYLRNCVGFVCDALSYGGVEIRPPPIDFGEDPFRFPNDLEPAILYWRNQAVEQARREDVRP